MTDLEIHQRIKKFLESGKTLKNEDTDATKSVSDRMRELFKVENSQTQVTVTTRKVRA